MEEKRVKICENCLFGFKDLIAYECRFKAPKVNGKGRGYFPKVMGDDWCGQFQWENSKWNERNG